MKILIAGANFNRLKIARICWKKISITKASEDLLKIYDDCTTDYDPTMEFFTKCGFHAAVVPSDINHGIHKQRALQIENVSRFHQEFDGVYFTDSDAYHDDDWRKRLEELAKRYPDTIIGLYNTIHHPKAVEEGDIVIQQYCPGISMYLPMHFIIKLAQHPGLKQMQAWDYDISNILGKPPVVVSKTSYVEHFGADGIHNDDFERDRALNPTRYLRKRRDVILRKLK